MNATTIVGYAWDGAIYCPSHMPDGPEAHDGRDEPSPVFASDEGWEQDTCDTCHWPLDDSREVYGLWLMEPRVALCLHCYWSLTTPAFSIAKRELGYDTWPIMDGWSDGAEVCGGCGERLLPEPDENDEQDKEADR